MKIVILDAYAANTGDLSWEPISALGELDIYDRTARDEVLSRCEGKTAVLINKAILDAEILSQLPDLKYIGYLATGYNTVDLHAASKQGIVVSNARGYSSQSVAQHSIAILLDWCNQVSVHSQSVRKGDWQNAPDWTYRQTAITELADKTMGIIGLGNIGLHTAQIAKALGMNVIAYNPHSRPTDEVKWVSLDTIFSQSDVISLHCPLTPQNEGLINRSRLGQMKKNAILINTARGGLINENDLAEALQNAEIGAALLDVLSSEPPQANNPLLQAPNCKITPHIAWASQEARKRLIEIVADNLKAFIDGKAQSVVNSGLL